uniref:Uncharacterized protein n=1 Tax=Guillardia theta TaxID=55529 RepID=A0A7S4P465_GUITH
MSQESEELFKAKTEIEFQLKRVTKERRNLEEVLICWKEDMRRKEERLEETRREESKWRRGEEERGNTLSMAARTLQVATEKRRCGFWQDESRE